MEEKLLTTRELKVGEFYTYKGEDRKEKNLSRVGYFTNSTSGPIKMIYVVREVNYGKSQKKLEVISLDRKYSPSDEGAKKTIEHKYISLEKGERDLDIPVWYWWKDSTNIDMWFSEAGCVLDRKLRSAFPEYKMYAPNMMFGDIVVESRTGIILSIDKVIGKYVISRLYYDKENLLDSHEKYVIFSKSDSSFRLATVHEVSLLSSNLPKKLDRGTGTDSVYLDYLLEVLSSKSNNKVMQRLEAGCTFKVGSETFIGPGMYLCNGNRIPTLQNGTVIEFEKDVLSTYPICSVNLSNSVAEFIKQSKGSVGYFDVNSMKCISDVSLDSHFHLFKRKNFHGYLVNKYFGSIVRYESEKDVHDYLQTKPSFYKPGTDGPIVSILKYNGQGKFSIVTSSFYQEIICNGTWRLVDKFDAEVLDEIFELLGNNSSGGCKKIDERSTVVTVNGEEVKVSKKMMKELKKLAKK